MCLEHSIFEHPTETGSQSTKHGDRFRNVSLFLNFEVLLKITSIHKKKSDVLRLALATSPFFGTWASSRNWMPGTQWELLPDMQVVNTWIYFYLFILPRSFLSFSFIHIRSHFCF